MRLDFDLKTLTSFLVSLLLVGVQFLQGVYDGGVSGLEWLGLALVLVGPAGLVAAVNNTPWSPATKAIAQSVSAVAVVVVQGVMNVYDGGLNGEEWLGLGLLLLSTLAVYVVPGTTRARNAVGAGSLGLVGVVLMVVAALVAVLTLLGVVAPGGWVGVVVVFVIGLALWLFDGHRGRRTVV